MTNADQIAWKIAAENPIPATDDLAKSIANALREAEERGEARGHTAGFNEAKERAVEICRAYEKRMGTTADMRAAAGKPYTVALSKEGAAGDVATALQAMKQGGGSDD